MKKLLVSTLVVVTACVSGPAADGTSASAAGNGDGQGTATLLFAGDVMVGRGVSAVLDREGPGFFEGVRFVVSSADIAAANLESPLTDRPHIAPNPNALEASPGTARLLAGAGFDVLALANNHSGDAGPGGVLDTIDALTGSGIRPVGAGRDRVEAEQAVLVEVNGVTVAYLAFDTTQLGSNAAEGRPGVVPYSSSTAHRLVRDAVDRSDLVVVALHGGVEYLSESDPVLEDISDDLVDWGADVVWGHGPHVAQPVSVVERESGDAAIVATSLGNLVFDQQRPATREGLILEVLVSSDGVEAYRVGATLVDDLRLQFRGWEPPHGPAALVDNQWWGLVSDPEVRSTPMVVVERFDLGDVVFAAEGDVTGDGDSDLVISYRHPFRVNEVNALYPERDFMDTTGRSAHIGVFDTVTMEPRWAAGTLLRPIATVAVCDGSLGLAFDGLDDPEIVATGAWTWWDFGFAAAPELPGPGRPLCADVDGDGWTEPVITGR